MLGNSFKQPRLLCRNTVDLLILGRMSRHKQAMIFYLRDSLWHKHKVMLTMLIIRCYQLLFDDEDNSAIVPPKYDLI